jgi:hypothetical protein
MKYWGLIISLATVVVGIGFPAYKSIVRSLPVHLPARFAEMGRSRRHHQSAGPIIDYRLLKELFTMCRIGVNASRALTRNRFVALLADHRWSAELQCWCKFDGECVCEVHMLSAWCHAAYHVDLAKAGRP